ncbi:MAG: hypothetical protein GY906_03195 [bacterium]|nr:hypothetical protein [bacterium]
MSQRFVDFRALGEGLDLYDPQANYFLADDGSPRPGERDHHISKVVTTTWQAEQRRLVAKGADQQVSFEAVVGRPGEDGLPRQLIDRTTGAIDPEVLELWSRYDLRRILVERWDEIGPSLRGKLNIWVGSSDSYYLDEAVRLLKKDLEAMDAGAVPSFVTLSGVEGSPVEISSMYVVVIQ